MSEEYNDFGTSKLKEDFPELWYKCSDDATWDSMIELIGMDDEIDKAEDYAPQIYKYIKENEWMMPFWLL